MDFEHYHKILPLYCTVCDMIQQHPDGITDYELKSLLQTKEFSFDDEDFFGVISMLLISDGCIQRDDYWNRGAVYSYIKNPHLHDSGYSRHYYSFTVDDNVSDKCFVVLADTHVGHPEFEDFRMLDGIYSFAIGDGADKCFHMGDLFTGKMGDCFSKEEMLDQINSFISSYPKPYPWEMRTYVNVGNHDEYLHGFFHPDVKKEEQPYLYDLRGLNTYHPDFFVIPRERFRTKFSNIDMHFGHRLYVSGIRPEVKLFALQDMNEEERWLDERYDVLWSGHLHNGFIYTTDVPWGDRKQILFLGVPSTSKYNLGGVVAYLAHLHYENQCVSTMDVDFLKCDNNYHITKEEGVHWDFSGNNKVIKKLL